LRLSPGLALGAFLLAATAVRLLVGAAVPLTEDEAYYRLWSLRPALGYFDHPPMIAWWIWLGRAIAGDDPLGVRLLPALSTAATTWLTFDVARQLGLGERIAACAGIWLNATLLVGFAGEMAVPDEPATLFWMAALACVFRARTGGGAWWLGAGAAAGLACLSKYSALFLAPGLLLWLALTAEGRRALRTPWPWLGALAAGAVFAPNIIWNAQHGWMTFAKQFGRVAATSFEPAFVAKLLIDQTLLPNPLIALFVGFAIRRRAAWPLLVISAPFAAYLVFHSLHAEVQGQWPAPLYPSLVIAAAATAEDARGLFAGLRRAAAPFGLAFVAAAFAWLLALPDRALPFRDPLAPYRDWTGFAARVEAARIAAGAAWVGSPTYGVAAQLAATPPLRAPSAQILQRERYTFETAAERADFRAPGVVLIPPKNPSAPRLARCFADVQPLAPIVRGEGPSAASYAAFRVAGPLRDIEHRGCADEPAALWASR
jgi:4-amino-4-deoxy-L-arabinose transferase-like glycosyltransferase